MEVADNAATILADTAELSEEIDLQRAIAAKERATKRLSAPSSDIDVKRAEIAMRKAVARIGASEDKR